MRSGCSVLPLCQQLWVVLGGKKVFFSLALGGVWWVMERSGSRRSLAHHYRLAPVMMGMLMGASVHHGEGKNMQKIEVMDWVGRKRVKMPCGNAGDVPGFPSIFACPHTAYFWPWLASGW